MGNVIPTIKFKMTDETLKFIVFHGFLIIIIITNKRLIIVFELT